MDQLRQLCALPDSTLGRVARAQLEALRVTLRALRDVSGADPGTAACDGALAELAELTGSGAPGEPGARPGHAGSPPDEPAQVPLAPDRPEQAGDADRAAGHPAARPAAPDDYAKLAGLAAGLAGSTEAADYLGSPVPPDGATLGQLWEWYHLMLLRLPTVRAAHWRGRATHLSLAPPEPAGPGDPSAQGQASDAAASQWEDWPVLPSMRETTVLVPPLPTAHVTGIRCGGTGKLDEWADKAVRSQPGPIAAHGAVLGTWVARLAARDTLLNHSLESLAVSGLRSLQEPRERQGYLNELARRLVRAADQAAPPADQLRAALALDEALRSVIHIPPAADKSWWANVGRTSERLVLDLCTKLLSEGVDVEVVVPGAMYADARKLTRNDIALGVGGEVGQVLAVLKLWSRIEGREYRGRVVHRLETGRGAS